MSNFLSIVAATFSGKALLMIVGGTVFGMIMGAIPGLTGTLAVAIVIPLTFYLTPVEAMALLLAIYKSSTYGGSISSILLGIPGTPASACTAADGYSLARRGEGLRALEAAVYASTFADVVSNLCLIICAAQIAKLALKFGPCEYTMLILFSLVVVSSVSADALIKGLLSAFAGLALCIIGMDPINASPRFTFGQMNLMSGLTLIPVLIGLFAMSEIFMVYAEHRRGESTAVNIGTLAHTHLGLKEFFSYFMTLLKSSLIGVGIGALPGSGASTASFVSYSEAKRCSKHPEEFGKGSINGILASEAGNNGVCGATLIPLLTLGIPGDSITAIMYGALILQGITPGPLVFTQQGNIITGIYISLFVCSLFMLFFGKIGNPLFVQVLKVKQEILFPVIFIICFAGTYAINNSMYDVGVMIIAGVVGYFFRRMSLPVAPIIIGFVLGGTFEKSLRQTLIASRGSFSVLLKSPIAIAFLTVTVVIFVFQIRKEWKRLHSSREAAQQ